MIVSPGTFGARRTPLRTAVGTLAIAGGLLLAGCSTPLPETSTTSTPAGPIAQTVLVDVRTPAEYAAGHLDGAVNIDVQAPDFAQRIATLDPSAPTQVYCRSGNRSAAAVQAMRDAGFTNVTNIGGLDEAASRTGITIVS